MNHDKEELTDDQKMLRNMLAGLALAGLLAKGLDNPKDAAYSAVTFADALIAELDK